MKVTWQKTLPYVLLVGAVIGLIASFALTYDKLHLAQDPNYQAGCNLNPILSCGSVMKMPQANLLGVPNTIFGLIAFSMLFMFGLTLLAGATFKRWLWLCAQAMATVGIAFMHYLFFQAVFRIQAICPWCFAVWMITIPIFFGITMYNLRVSNFGAVQWRPLNLIIRFIDRHSIDILVLWYVVIFVILGVKFWYYWSTLL